MKIIISAILFVLVSFDSFAQECPSRNSYNIVAIGEKVDGEVMRLPLYLWVKEDSLIVSRIPNDATDAFFALRVVKKECSWNKDFTEGKTVFDCLMGEVDKLTNIKATLSFLPGKPKHLELLWPDKDTRVMIFADK